MAVNQPYSAFTQSFSGRTNVLVSRIRVSQAFTPNPSNRKMPSQSVQALGIWDTGATTSVITEALVKKLNLKPYSKTQVRGVNGTTTEDTYYVNVLLPNKFLVSHVRAPQCKQLAGNFDFLIGMDIIGIGDLSVSHANGKTMLSFRAPSLGGVDYAAEASAQNQNHALLNKIQKNSPSPQARAKAKKRRKKNKKKNRI